MRWVGLICGVLVLTWLVAAAPASRPSKLVLAVGAPKDVADLYAKLPEYQRKALTDADAKLMRQKDALKKADAGRYSKERSDKMKEVQQQIAETNHQIELLKAGAIVVAPSLGYEPLKDGQFFKIYGITEVVSVADHSNLILGYVDQATRKKELESWGSQFSGVEVDPSMIRRGSRDTAEPPPLKPNAVIYLSSVATKGMVDGSQFSSDSVFRITGTKSYNTSRGERMTVFVAVPIDYAEFIK